MLKSGPTSCLPRIALITGEQLNKLLVRVWCLDLETFANFLIVSVSVSKNLVSEKSLGIGIKKFGLEKKSLVFGIGKFGLGKKVSVSVSKKFCLGKKSLVFGIGKFGLLRKVSVSVSKKLVLEKKSRYWSQKIWSRKKKLQRKSGQK